MSGDNSNNIGIFVVIPAFLEKDYIERSLHSLVDAKTIDTIIEVLIVINASENTSAEIIEELISMAHKFKKSIEFNC